MKVDPRFPTKLDAVSDVPEPLRSALTETLPPDKPARLLVHAPAFQTDDERSPATVLAVTDTGWLVVSETEEGGATVEKSDFNNTLFLELTPILLLGELRITFAAVDTAYSVTLRFERVGDELYREAIDLILGGIDPSLGTTVDEDQPNLALLEAWPLKIRNEAERFWPKGKRLLSALHWPAVANGTPEQPVPAGALLVTERELVVISEATGLSLEPVSESPLEEEGTEQLHGIVTFIPRVRVVDFHVGHQDHCDVLTLQLRAAHGGERLEIIFPSDQERDVAKAMEQLTRAAS